MQFSSKLALILAAVGLPFGVALGALWDKAPPAPAGAPATAPTAKSRPLLAQNDEGITVLRPGESAPLRPTKPQVITIAPVQSPKKAVAPSTAQPLTAPRRALAATSPLVCVDPGHPSETSAGANSHGLSENRLNWQVALALKPMLEARGIRCVLTKNSENQYVTNRRRAEIANGANQYRQPAQLFIRLHCDVGSNRGYTWYYPDRAGSKGGVTGPKPDIQRESGRAARILNEAMKPVLRPYLKSNPVLTDASTYVGGKQGGVLTGSIFAKVPTALLEMCYINQKSDAQFIASSQGRQLMAKALATGIESYLRR